MANIIKIPKKMADKGELIIIPRIEYEKLLVLRDLEDIDEYEPTPTEKRSINEGLEQIKRGEYVTSDQLRDELGL